MTELAVKSRGLAKQEGLPQKCLGWSRWPVSPWHQQAPNTPISPTIPFLSHVLPGGLEGACHEAGGVTCCCPPASWRLGLLRASSFPLLPVRAESGRFGSRARGEQGSDEPGPPRDLNVRRCICQSACFLQFFNVLC